ncbi:MAG: endonuclease domain-containing protein [Byssovorax sp.]
MLKPLARVMRKEPTAAEALLWKRLADSTVLGQKFRRQHVIDRFIVDFYCPTARLAIELDGPIHDDHREYDAARQATLESLGIRVLRFTNDEVMTSLDTITATIARALGQNALMPRCPPPRTRGGAGGGV